MGPGPCSNTTSGAKVRFYASKTQAGAGRREAPQGGRRLPARACGYAQFIWSARRLAALYQQECSDPRPGRTAMSAHPLGHALRQIRRLADEQAGQDLSDADLLQRFRAGREEAAFALLVQRHGPMVL